VTATGRLSSSNPNFQNLPKGNKFEVRRAIVSRFPGGKIGEVDFSGLEFRVAGMLSHDQQIIDDVMNGKDVHKQTASIILQKTEEEVTKDERSQAKAYTFQPLYGGGSNGKAPHIRSYFDSYFTIYAGLQRWHKSLGDEVISQGYIQTPSGRQFAFPGAKRLRSGRVTNHTQVVNFPCQSFATADIVPLSCIRALTRFREEGLQSKLILTVHDSIVVDIHPDEIDAVGVALQWAMSGVDEELKDRFDYQTVLPLDIEYSVGNNWMEMEELSVATDT
jgi:DNA polymerase-1